MGFALFGFMFSNRYECQKTVGEETENKTRLTAARYPFFLMMGVRAAAELIPTQLHTVSRTPRTELVFLWEQPLAVRSQQCGVPAVGGKKQGYRAQMDFRATSVPPPDRLLSAEAPLHTPDRRRWRRGHSSQSLRKQLRFCLSCKQYSGSRSGHTFAFHKDRLFVD